MKLTFGAVVCAVIVGALAWSAPVNAKTVKECEKEWRADKKANQAKGITEKAYVAKCRTPEAAAAPKEKSTKKEPAKEKAAEKKMDKTAAPAGGEKTVKACEEEWRANKKANQAKKITLKAYVEKCRSGTAAAAPMVVPAAKREQRDQGQDVGARQENGERARHGQACGRQPVYDGTSG